MKPAASWPFPKPEEVPEPYCLTRIEAFHYRNGRMDGKTGQPPTTPIGAKEQKAYEAGYQAGTDQNRGATA